MQAWFLGLDPQLQMLAAIGGMAAVAVAHVAISAISSVRWRLISIFLISLIVVAALWFMVHPVLAGLAAVGSGAGLACSLIDLGLEQRRSLRWTLWFARPVIFGAMYAGMFALVTGTWLGWVLTTILGVTVGWFSIGGQAFLKAFGRTTYGIRVVSGQ